MWKETKNRDGEVITCTRIVHGTKFVVTRRTGQDPKVWFGYTEGYLQTDLQRLVSYGILDAQQELVRRFEELLVRTLEELDLDGRR